MAILPNILLLTSEPPDAKNANRIWLNRIIRQYHNLFDVKINKDDINHVCREINKKMIWIPDPKKMDSYVSQINGKVKELELKITFDELMALPNIILA